ncbi:MAG: endonuclease Q family protein [Clostridia bacterium]|nr:endonuclease Q family protein [Clostridia bacterium]
MFIADLHTHSKYSRATSRECIPETLEWWARRKGIGVIGTGDFTHPAWRAELKEKLVPTGTGLYTLKEDLRREAEVAGSGVRPQFIISGEISSIYKKDGKVRKVHNLILLPSLEHAETIACRLEAIGNVRSDGRPILGLDSRDLLEIVLEAAPEALFIPAHIWTPHFSLFGAYSGFDRIEECFGDLTDHIYALETGLSSDPPMNWRLSALDRFVMVSNSDAHSPANLGREANIFKGEPSYTSIFEALKNKTGFQGTIEFFPEEGKYHYDGHRPCKVCCKPEETRATGGVCPVCSGRITVGVLHRVEALADREEGFIPAGAKSYSILVPLCEVIASSLGSSVGSKKVQKNYENLLKEIGPELFVLQEAALADIAVAAGVLTAEGVRRLRCGQVAIQPGYDGEYGKIKVIEKSEIGMLAGQLCFLTEEDGKGQKPSEIKEPKTQAHPLTIPDTVPEAPPPQALAGGGPSPV